MMLSVRDMAETYLFGTEIAMPFPVKYNHEESVGGYGVAGGNSRGGSRPPSDSSDGDGTVTEARRFGDD